MNWQPGQFIRQRYELQRCLRDRAGHQVWLALDHTSPTPSPLDSVILKVLIFGGQLKWDDVKLFEREIQILKKIDYPQIPQLRDHFSIESPVFQLCLVEDYIPAPSLQTFLSRGKQFSEQQIWLIATQILNILIYLHGLSPPVLHRDIKPSNILITAEKVVYLIDFGAVQIQRKPASIKDAPTVVGTYGYTPLEQFAGHPVPASDLFALGATLIHLLSNKAPVITQPEALKLKIPATLNLYSQLLQWLAKLTAPQVRDRFQTATEAQQALQAALTEQATFLQQPREGVALPRLGVRTQEANLILSIKARWNQETMAQSDLLLLLGLSYFPLLLGGILSLVGLSVLGSPISSGVDSLLMLAGGVSAWWGSNTSIKNLSAITLRFTPDELHLTRSIYGITVSSNQWSWTDIQTLKCQPQSKEEYSVILQLQPTQDITLVTQLSADEAETLIQNAVQWKIDHRATKGI